MTAHTPPSQLSGVLTAGYRLAVLVCLGTACVLLSRGNAAPAPASDASNGNANRADASADLLAYLDARLDRLEVRVFNLPTLPTGALAVELEHQPTVEVANMPDFFLDDISVNVRQMPAVEVSNLPDFDRSDFPVRVTNLPNLDLANIRVEVSNMPVFGLDTVPVRVTNFPNRFD